MQEQASVARIPMRTVGPVAVCGAVEGEVRIPLATFETPLWPSVNRGAKVSRASGGIRVTVIDERMTRSVLVEAPDAATAAAVAAALPAQREALAAEAAGTSRYGRLIDLHTRVVGRLLFIRFALATGDAAGHNMVTQAADRMLTWILDTWPELEHRSVSGNYCTDKKVSSVNAILGRGRHVAAELTVPAAICRELLHTDPAAIADLNLKKNLIGTLVAGGVQTANAHVANILLAFYLATGQDAANIVEGSQAITLVELTPAGDLYVAVDMPSIIVGTVGNGKDLDFVRANLSLMGCLEDRAPGENARRLAAICGAAVLCGELSLLAAQTNPGELMRAHRTLERRAP